MAEHSFLTDGPGDEAGERSGIAGRLDEQLCFALYAATNAVIRAYRPLLKDLGLTYPQYLVMLILWEHGTQQVGEIADRLRLATHAISPIVDRLAEAGLALRSRSPGDGRVVRVELTEAGRHLEGAAALVQRQIRCAVPLDDDAVVRLRSLLIGLAGHLSEP